MHSEPDAERGPRLSLVVFDDGSSVVPDGVLPYLSPRLQRDVSGDEYEIVVVCRPERAAMLERVVAEGGAPARLARASDSRAWPAVGAALARGAFIAFLGEPGVPSLTLVSSLIFAVGAHPDGVLVVATFDAPVPASVPFSSWLSASGFPADERALLRQATAAFEGEPPFAWLDVVKNPKNMAVPRPSALKMFEAEPSLTAERSFEHLARESPRVQIVGDAMVRQGPGVPPENRGRQEVDSSLRFFGRVDHVCPSSPASRASGPASGDRPYLSVIVVVHDMAREAPRTLTSLLAAHQRGISAQDYEVIVVDNASRVPLGEAAVHAVSPEARYYFLRDAPPSPAFAINYGVARARGEALAIMIDGACLCSPGLLAEGMRAFRAFRRPVVLTRYFYLGPGPQIETIRAGYDQGIEDRLLASVDFPVGGYRLFEIASPITLGTPKENWLSPWFESNGLFMPKSVFEEMGGYDERFNLPGGGALNIDVLIQSCRLPDTQPVQLIGEGVFHQVHGGITTNTSEDDHEAKRRAYVEQYIALRGPVPETIPKSFFFMGHLPVPAARWKMRG